MLRIRIDGQDIETTLTLLAKLVLDGKADRYSVTKLPGGTAEQPLEQALGAPHVEALTVELHRRLQMMCSLTPPAVDVQELCDRVEGLCQWRWRNLPAAARFFWAAGWLNELADRGKNAVEFYDAFLLMPSGESHLRLLALNNRGVLRIQLGRLAGVQDLARAAISDCGLRIADCGSKETQDANPQEAGLPTACFNLLNLINVAFDVAGLLQAVDEELVRFFAGLPDDLTTWWLGPLDGVPDVNRAPSMEGEWDEASEANRQSAIRDPQFGGLLILRDPTYRRLNTLVARLSVRARGLAPDSRPGLGHASYASRQLSLWDCRLNGDRDGPGQTGSPGNRFVPDQHRRFAEAASLLLSDDVPSALTRPEDPLARMEQSAREELAVTEGYLASGRYELAQSRLEVQRKVLLSLSPRGEFAAVLARVQEQLEKAAALAAQEEELQFQQTCARLVAEVQEFCTLTDVSQAQSRLADLQRRLQQSQAPARARTSAETAGLLEELGTRLECHMDGLKRARIEALIEEPWREVRQNRPCERTVPVPASVYQALAQCRLLDPQGSIDDWAALEQQLDAHQAQYHAYRALSALQAGLGSWDQVRDDLAEALRCDPSSWLTVSSLFGWGIPEGGRKNLRRASLPAANGRPPFTTDQAGLLLEEVLRQWGADARRCQRLWQCVEMTLSPALAEGHAETLARARFLGEKCLECWPAGAPGMPGRADPRHPVNRFLEACEKARCLTEAEQLLEARPPRLEEAKRHLAGILQSGADTRDQLRRLVAGFYLAQCREKDSPSVQRQVLAALEAWVDTVPPEAVLQMRGREIVEETEKVRVAVAERSGSSPGRARPDEPAANERERGVLAKSRGGRNPRPRQDETGNTRKEA